MIYLSDKYANVPSFMAGKKMLEMAGVKLRQYVPGNKQLIIDLDIDNV